MPSSTSPSVNLSTFAPLGRSQALARVHPAALSGSPAGIRIAVIGAGVFGGWTALQLLRQGFKVTLLDAWGPGNSRSSSGDETRVIRCIYGPNETYFQLTVRAFALWQEFEKQSGRQLLFPTGALWFMYQPNDPTLDAAMPMLRAHQLPYEQVSIAEARQRWPHIQYEDLNHVFWEKHAGYLSAREACRAVMETFVREGGRYEQQSVWPGKITHGKLEDIRLMGGGSLTVDAYVFAAGAWLGQVFPEVLQNRIQSVRQEVYYFGTPLGQFTAYDALPVWIDWNVEKGVYYGIPGSAGRGFKVAFDRTEGPFFDPTYGQRTIEQELLDQARRFMDQRFPAMYYAPLIESRVCQYPSTPDGNFIVDTHPEADNVWLVGGGSGHGFKMGPALGEYVAHLLLGKQAPNPLFAMDRF